MSKIKPERAYSKKIFDGFDGLSSVTPPSEGGLHAISNFRIREDGVLEKRCGYRTHAIFPEPVRGFWQGTVGESSRCFAVSGCTVYLLHNGTQTGCSDIATADGAVCFFTYSDRLFLSDGYRIYAFDDQRMLFAETDGYAPLYGRNWHPTDHGEVYEPLNLLSPKLRVHYLNTTGTTEFRLPYYAASIDKVRIDNRNVTGYSLNAAGDVLTVSTVGSSVEVAFRMAMDDSEFDRVRTCTRAFSDRINDRERLILYGSSDGSDLLCATPVDWMMQSSCNVFYPDTPPLYFTSDGLVNVGTPESPVTALYRNHDRILAFHKTGAVSVNFDPENDSISVYPLLRGIGCCVNGVDLSVEGEPIILNERGILQLSSTVSEPDVFSQKELSGGLSEIKELCKNPNTAVFYDTAHGELWLRDPSNEKGTVWVMRLSTKQWYCFDAINATFFCNVDGSPAYADEFGNLFVFDDDLFTDGGIPITATLETEFLSLSYPELSKRSLRVSLCGVGRGTVNLTLETEKQSKTYAFPEDDSPNPSLIDLRAALGRFRFVRVRISDHGWQRSQYHRLALYANL